jgi:hypothetical protein
MNDLENLGKGALPDPNDPRDYTAEAQFGASEPVLWGSPLGRPEPIDFNQKSSSSCVGCGTRNLHWSINNKDFSRRDIYSRIYLPQGGAYLRDGVKTVVDIGNQTQVQCPDPAIPTEANMRIKSTLPDSAGERELAYFVVKQNLIDGVAQAIRDYKACIFGITGSNPAFADKTNPRPPKQGETLWQHCIEGFDYHLHSGVKCIIAKSSWCSGSHHVHHIKEEFFTSGNTFNAWCIIPKEETFMTNSLILKREIGNKPDGSPLWEYSIGDPATSPDGLITLMRNRGIAPPLKPDGTLDFERVDQLVSGVITSNK